MASVRRSGPAEHHNKNKPLCAFLSSPPFNVQRPARPGHSAASPPPLRGRPPHLHRGEKAEKRGKIWEVMTPWTRRRPTWRRSAALRGGRGISGGAVASLDRNQDGGGKGVHRGRRTDWVGVWLGRAVPSRANRAVCRGSAAAGFPPGRAEPSSCSPVRSQAERPTTRPPARRSMAVEQDRPPRRSRRPRGRGEVVGEGRRPRLFPGQRGLTSGKFERGPAASWRRVCDPHVLTLAAV